MSKSPYITDPLEYVEFKHRKETLQVDLNVLIEAVKSNPDYLKTVTIEMNDRNERLRQQKSEIITTRNKTKKARKKSETQGKNNVANGTFGTPEMGRKGVEAQKESGWTWSKEMQDARSRGGVTSSAKQIANGTFEKFRSAGTKAGNKIIKCKYCGFESDLRNIKKAHNEKCKQKPSDMKRVLETLPGIFTRNQWMDALQKCGFNYTSKSAYIILKHEIYMTKINTGIYCKLGYKPSKKEVEDLQKTNGKATDERLEKINKIKSILGAEFTGTDITKAGAVFGFGSAWCRSILRTDCDRVYQGVPGSRTDVSRYSFKKVAK